MIIIYHQNNCVTSIWNTAISEGVQASSKKVSKVLFELATAYPDEFIVWCNEHIKDDLNLEEFQNVALRQKALVSFNLNETPYLTDAIGYVNETPFIKINRKVVYPTWLMSSIIGGVNASILLAVEHQITPDTDFDYFLNSLARLSMPLGVLCYSNPKLLKANVSAKIKLDKTASNFVLFKFVKQHYKAVWVFLLFVNLMIYQNRRSVLSLLFSLVYKRRALKENSFNHIKLEEKAISKANNISIDVVIPTIGRKKYLYNTLKDLSQQTLLPKQVIIVEQNPITDAKTELNYLVEEKWPFKIKHHFTHQTGACNARNIALKMVKNEWVFLADDDIVLDHEFFEEASKIINNSTQKAFTFRCHLKEEKELFKTVKQWETFGSGCSIVNIKDIKKMQFSMAFEHGFGEDTDFGMQLRNKGVDIIYLPEPKILHLKAPFGGFRTTPELLWDNDTIKPKPSPTILLFFKKYFTTAQILGYKTTLFLKYYRVQNIKNPFKYYKNFQIEWERSHYWTNQLMQNHN
ncbi:glycosyltransferase family 2 protein [Algibacter sp. 2305UL17-15]|uniref:glycosyltransferase family 2 protein n=1 Tax=Algibacter sp. 2305UL17-15 TaxID=3231268 RepID=UPI003458A210